MYEIGRYTLPMTKKIAVLFMVSLFFIQVPVTDASYHFSNYQALPPIHVYASTGKIPAGMTPDQIKTIYKLPKTGGHGTIAIIGAYNDVQVEADLAAFDAQFKLPACTTANGCLEKHLMAPNETANENWADETALDVEWAHAIAPSAKILLVEAATPSGINLMNAVDYVDGRAGIVSVSMSFGGPEYPEENTFDPHFLSKSGAVFFAASGDSGAGTSWPAVSPNVIAVGGTSIVLNSNGTLKSETAWSGSGGGVSMYERQPAYQAGYSIPKAGGMRAIPDVAYGADPRGGFPIVHNGLWMTVGGTSAGSPQWAAIAALGSGVSNARFYADKAASNATSYFHDITSGQNGSCGYLCTARKHYDYVTGLGSPLTDKF